MTPYTIVVTDVEFVDGCLRVDVVITIGAGKPLKTGGYVTTPAAARPS